MNKVLCLLLALFCVTALSALGAPVVKECGPYRVVFEKVRQVDHLFSFRTTVNLGKRSVVLATDWRAKDEDEALWQLGRLTGEKEGYLFTPSSCAGGNAWRCELEVVVAAEPRLRVLGAVGRHLGWDKPGRSLEGAFFRDGFDGLEINPFTCHAAAPSFEVMLERKGSRLQLSKDATWNLSGKHLDGYRKMLGRSKDRQELSSAFLGALALTRMCGRTEEWRTVRLEGKKALGVIDSERMVNYVNHTLAKYKWARMP